MTPEIPIGFCTVLGVLAAFQMLLILGLPFGRFAWGGKTPVLPVKLRVGSGVSIVVYAAFAVVALERAALISILPAPFLAVAGMWVIAAYLLLSVLPNLTSKSRYERRVMVPVSLVLAGLAFLVALS